MSAVYINRSLLISFYMLFDVGAFKAKFFSAEQSVKRFIQRVEIGAVPAAIEIKDVMEVKVSRKRSPLKESQLVTGENHALGRLRRDPNRQVLRVSLASKRMRSGTAGLETSSFMSFTKDSFLSVGSTVCGSCR